MKRSFHHIQYVYRLICINGQMLNTWGDGPANKETDSQLDVPFYSEVLDMLEVNWTKLDINWTKLNKTELFILEM